jgi:tRNA(Arg) A34 adenosine deaminase TadA
MNPLSQEQDEFYMRQALKVAQNALAIGEVPVGCVIVHAVTSSSSDATEPVIISHGSNQVNATRDATRHAEIVAIDRMLTGGVSSDQLRLPPEVYARPARSGMLPEDSPLLTLKNQNEDGNSSQEQLEQYFLDHWINVPDDPSHWKNSYGWGSGRIYNLETLAQCHLYVTCEPCIMCAAALAQVRIGRVVYGCFNDKFGGCGSILHLHNGDSSRDGYPIVSGILEEEAISLLRSFYNRENFNAPDDKRKRKDGNKSAGDSIRQENDDKTTDDKK